MSDQKQRDRLLSAISSHSPISWAHINLLGEYDFSDEKLKDSVGRIVIKKIQSSIQDEELITFAKKKVRFIKPSDLEDYNVPDTIPELISNTDGQHILSVNSDAFYAHIGKDTTSQENN